MKIVNETELMTNQKASQVIVPDKQFEALQSMEGYSLLFSIGLDNILYCSREVPGDTHGWVRVDLSSSLSASCYNGAPVAAKTFDIAQDLSSAESVDIALVVTVNGVDYLHIAAGFNNTIDNWKSNAPSFTQYNFDDYAHTAYAGSPINEVQIVDGNSNKYIIADLISDASTQTISRYYIDTSLSLYPNPLAATNPKLNPYCAWVPHNLSVDLQAGQITSLLGCGPGDGPNSAPNVSDGAGNNIGGMYVLGHVSNQVQLMYAPTFNFFTPEMQQNPTIFNIPQQANTSNMAMALSAPASGAPYTDLFFASNGSLYFLANADQTDTGTANATPALIYTHDLFKGIQTLHIENWNDNIVLWGQSLSTDNSGTSQIFMMEGLAGQEANADSWSCPIPLLFNVVNAVNYTPASYSINNKYSTANSIDPVNGNEYNSCNVIFAQQVVDEIPVLTQLFQDPVTSAWQERRLLTQPAAENIQTVIYETTSYTSHIEITDDNNIPIPNLLVSVWSSSPCSVYVTDASNTAAYRPLDNLNPLNLTTDFSGNIAIMQPIDTIGGISYYVESSYTNPNNNNQVETCNVTINPLTNTLSSVNDNLSKNGGLDANVTDEYGANTPLVNKNVNSGQKAAITTNLQKVYAQQSKVPTDGTIPGQPWPGTKTSVSAELEQTPKSQHLIRNLKFDPVKHQIHAVSFGKNARFYDGIDAVKEMGIVLNADGSLHLTMANGELGSFLGAIECKPGHLFRWMKTEANELSATLDNIIQVTADGLVHCLFTIAGDLYHFVIKCMNDLANIMHTLLTAIETAFEDIVKWIGMIFSFQDILRTHSVLKSVISIYLDYCRGNISTLNTDITNVFTSLKNEVDAKTGLPTSGLPPSTQTYGGAMQTSTPPKGSKSPSANYGTHHLKNNAANSNNNYAPDTSGILDTIFDDLLTMLENEGTAFTDAGAQIKAIAAKVSDGTTPFTTIITELMGVVIDLLLNTAEDFLQTLVTVFQQLMDTVTNVMDATIQIPVLSYLYKKMTKSDEFPNGQDLSALDLSCLISAIPVTIIYKLVKDAPPFPEGAVTDAIIAATDMDSLADAVANLDTVSSAAPGLLGHGSRGNMTPLNIAGSLSATFGAIGIDLCLLVKSNLPPEMSASETTTNRMFSCLNAVGYMQYLLPDLIGAIQSWKSKKSLPWYVTMNNICTCIGGGKTLIDAGSAWFTGKVGDAYGKYVSPGADFLLNVAWQVPTVFALIEQVKEPGEWVSSDINAIVSCIGGTTFDMSGMASPVLAESYYFMPPGEQRTIEINAWVAVISLLNLIWGGSCIATTFDGLPVPS